MESGRVEARLGLTLMPGGLLLSIAAFSAASETGGDEPDRLSGLALVGDTCHMLGGGELPDALRLRTDGGVPIENGTEGGDKELISGCVR